jgi:dihydrodipicolinate synthase/N-acetylneuraminate lyase
MITAGDLKGVIAMMPAFTTKNGDSMDAEDTVDIAALEAAVEKMVGDGANAIATTGSFGECHTLLWEEQKKLIDSTVQIVRKRVPVFAGCTTVNTRETKRQVKFAQEAGADGVLCGVPHYLPSSVDNAVQFYLDLAEAFPKLGIALYHNPAIHHVRLPVGAFTRLVSRPNIVAMKDSHRTPLEFMKLMNIVKGKISVFCYQTQLYPYFMLGASGCWSICAWMGPWPILELRDACFAGDWDKAKQLCLDIDDAYMEPGQPGDLIWRENFHKLVINEAGYCYAGPLRPPFRHVPADVIEQSKETAASWKRLCEKYPHRKTAVRASGY